MDLSLLPLLNITVQYSYVLTVDSRRTPRIGACGFEGTVQYFKYGNGTVPGMHILQCHMSYSTSTTVHILERALTTSNSASDILQYMEGYGCD